MCILSVSAFQDDKEPSKERKKETKRTSISQSFWALLSPDFYYIPTIFSQSMPMSSYLDTQYELYVWCVCPLLNGLQSKIVAKV